MPDSREQAISTGYNIVTGNDGEWHPDQTLEAIRAVYEAGVAAERERCARIAEECRFYLGTDIARMIRVLTPEQYAAAAIRADREPEPAAEAKREHVCYDAAFPEERVQCDCRVGQDHSDDECESLTGHEDDPAPATEEGRGK